MTNSFYKKASNNKLIAIIQKGDVPSPDAAVPKQNKVNLKHTAKKSAPVFAGADLRCQK
jgi:hypothetical protein